MAGAFSAVEGVIFQIDFESLTNRLVQCIPVRLNFIKLAHLRIRNINFRNDLLKNALGAFG